MKTRLAKTVALVVAAGFVAHLGVVSASLAGSDEQVAQAKSGGAAPNAKPTEKKPAPPKPRIAVFRLAGDLTELPPDQTFSFTAVGGISLRELTDRMKKAEGDSNVKAVVFLHEGGGIGFGQAEEIRAAMARLRAAGKEIYAHADELSTREYVLLSGTSRLSVVPTADLWVTGIFVETPYLRGLLDKIGVHPEFLTCGAYKSAAEMFLRNGPSPEAEAMENWLFDGIYSTSLTLIAQGRKVSTEKVREWVDEGPYTAEKAKTAGLIDAVEHRQDFEAMLKGKYGHDVVFDKKYGQKQQPTLDLSSPFAFFKLWGDMMGQGQKKTPAKPAVGIVYVDGPITLGGGSGLAVRRCGGVVVEDPQGPRRGGAGRLDQGRGAPGELAGRVGRRQRDHPRRHAAGEGEEAVRGLDGQRRRQRRLLRRLRLGRHLRRRVHHHRVDRRGGRQAGHERHVEEGRRHLQDLQAGPELRAARVRGPVHRGGARAAPGLDGRGLRRLQGTRPGDPRQATQEAAGRAGRGPGLHRQAGPRARPGRQDRRTGRRDRPHRRAGEAHATTRSASSPRPRTSSNN